MKKNFSRRTFLKAGAFGAVMLAGGLGFRKEIEDFFFPPKGLDAAEGLNISELRQMITKDSGQAACLMWRTESAAPDMTVEYRAGETVRSAQAEAVPFTDDGVEVTQYRAVLNDLTPGHDYEYRVRSGERASSWHTLKTDAGSEIDALIFPDSQSNDYSDWEALAQGAAARNETASLIINMGDLVDNGEDHRQWEAWFEGLAGIIDRMPFAPVMGNHETYNLDWKVRLPLAYLNYFEVPANGSREFEKYYYSFDRGPVHFVVLNTQEQETRDFKEGLLEEQLEWLRRDLAAADKPWKIVLMHRDVLQYRIHNRPGREEGVSEEGVTFMPIFEEFGVDVVFTAHLHTYRNRGHIRQGSRDERGPLYILTGVAGNVRYPNLWIDHALDETVAPQPETDNYLTLKGDASHLVIASYLPDGTEIDKTELHK